MKTGAIISRFAGGADRLIFRARRNLRPAREFLREREARTIGERHWRKKKGKNPIPQPG